MGQPSRQYRERSQSGPHRPPRKIFVFIHVPKTGGMTVHETLRDSFGSDYVRSTLHRQRGGHQFLASEEIEDRLAPLLMKASAVSGHLFRPPIHIPDAQTLYGTTLRHPFDWAVSHYLHAKRRRWIPFETTLDEYLTQHYALPNYQTQHFAASGLATDAIPVLEGFLAVGVTDMTAQFLALLRMRLHAEMGVALRPQYRHVNAAPGVRPKAADLTTSEVRSIVDKLGEDLKLYEYARHRFLKEWKASPLLTRVTTRVRRICRS